MPISTVYDPSVRLSRGVCRHNPVLADPDGRPWRAPAKIVDAVREAERLGSFDEILHKGDHITFAYGVLANVRSVMCSDTSSGLVELLTPLIRGRQSHCKCCENGSRLTIRLKNTVVCRQFAV